MKQAFNPYLPLNEYVPDGEPHIFGDRLYIFGSHDKENGDTYCMLDYVVYSAPLDDLSEFTCKGISFSGRQDPLATEERHDLYAPDVVQGNDGRFYLYYCLAGAQGKHGYDGPIGVAVCDTPDGKYEFYGHVRCRDGRLLDRFVAFDPAVINDDGVIRLYYGACLPVEKILEKMSEEQFLSLEAEIFHKTEEEIQKEPGGVMGPATCVLADDMLTVQEGPVRIIPERTKGTDFEDHGFFEASSIRKIGGTYYFVYSSQNCHELCYATSSRPDRDFVYGGTIISNGDIGYKGRAWKDSLNMIGNNHGGMVEIKGQWYIFYHRNTNRSGYSRQGCAEPIVILPDGRIPQVEMTSCGLNGGPLLGEGSYPAAICCNLTNGRMPDGTNGFLEADIPYITGGENRPYVRNISEGTLVGYKYFAFQGTACIRVKVRGDGGIFEVRTSMDGEVLGTITMGASEDWQEHEALIPLPKKTAALFFTYKGEGRVDLEQFTLTRS